MYRAVAEHYGNDSLVVQSVLLRLVIHYAGDISQPLHNANRNDRGGNDFPLKLHLEVDNLHALWDTAIYANAKVTPTPFSAQDWIAFRSKACTLAGQFEFEPADYSWTDHAPQEWT